MASYSSYYDRSSDNDNLPFAPQNPKNYQRQGYPYGRQPGNLPSASYPYPPPEEKGNAPKRYNLKRIEDLTVEMVLECIPGSIGSFDDIAASLGIPRLALRRFCANKPEIQEAIDDEMAAATERIAKKQYEEAVDGNPNARESFIKMVSGYFSKKDDKSSEPKTQVTIHVDAKPKTFKALDPSSGDIIEVGEDLKPIK